MILLTLRVVPSVTPRVVLSVILRVRGLSVSYILCVWASVTFQGSERELRFKGLSVSCVVSKGALVPPTSILLSDNVVLSIQIFPVSNSHEQPCCFIIAQQYCWNSWTILLVQQCCSRMITMLPNHCSSCNSYWDFYPRTAPPPGLSCSKTD